jgi:hypothetical protein
MDIKKILIKTKNKLTAHWDGTLSMRLPNSGLGSIYPQFDTKEALEEALLNAKWEEYSHPAIGGGAVGFIAELPGEIGMISLDDLDNDCEVRLVDPKQTGFLSAVVDGDNYETSSFTVMIIGDNDGDLVVYTFHPGDPVERSAITGEERTVTVSQAREIGFGLAKIELRN